MTEVDTIVTSCEIGLIIFQSQFHPILIRSSRRSSIRQLNRRRCISFALYYLSLHYLTEDSRNFMFID